VIPGTFVIDARGVVREAYFGVPDDDVLDAVVASLEPGAR
jgi:peroxiredoxin